MKLYSIIILFPLLFAVKNNKPMDFDPYSSDWKQVAKYEQKGLPRSAWDEVKKIHAKAISAENTPQIVKTFVYITRFTQELEENGQLKAIHDIEKYIDTHEGVEKQILQSFLGEWYQSYAMQNMYKLLKQTALADNDEDFRTWSLKKLQNKSAELFLASVKSENTKYTNVKDYEAIISDITNTSLKYRPTLYELLMDRALNHFGNTQAYITEPIYKFQMDDKRFFDQWTSFDITKLDVKDKSSKLYNAALLFHKYLNHFKKDNNKLALAETELDYLRLVHNNSILNNKQELYKEALDRLAKKYHDQEIYSKIMYEFASQYIHHNYRDKSSIKNNDSSEKPPKVIAFEICQTAIKAYPKSEGANSCKYLLQQIEQKNFNVQVKECNIPNQPNELELSYRNITELSFKLFKLDSDKIFESINQHDYERDNLTGKYGGKLIKEWTTTLPDFKDYEQHSALDNFPALVSGQYIIQAIYKRSIGKKNITHQSLFQVSNISYDLSQKDSKAQAIIRNRDTGEPISSATIKVYKTFYNRQKRKNVVEYVTTGKSDHDGFFDFNTENRVSYILRVSKDNDEYFNTNGYRFYHNRDPKSRHTAHVFTDRAIYRPGQKLHFKTLITIADKYGVPSVVANNKVTIYLKDANYQEVQKMELYTNEYGSIQGTFDLPKGGLNGNFRIEVNTGLGSGSKTIKVEEYKRPKFEVNLKNLSKTYALGEKIKVEGNAKAMAGVNLDKAKVQYSVKRSTRFPYYRRSWRIMPYWGNNSEIQIAHGVLKTDDEGNFTIEFEAMPDKSTPKKYKPEFNYSVTVDVTDVNGETHSDTKDISLAYHSIQLMLQAKDEADVSNTFDIITNTSNMDGNSMQVDVKLIIEKLIEPDAIPEQSSWNNIDTILNSKSKIQPIPQNQNLPFEQLKVEKQVFEKSYNNTKDYKISSSDIGLKAGIYRITLSHQDKSGELLENIQHITITDFAKGKFPKAKLLFSRQNQDIYQPGETVELDLGSGYKDIWVYYEVIKHNKTYRSAWAKLGGSTAINIPVTEKDRGGFHVITSFLLHNKLYRKNHSFQVPWSNKDLKIEYLTYRDHLDPGSKEEWRVKISGAKGDKVTAELLAGMYDASLDQFVANKWETSFYSTNRLNRHRAFYGFGISRLYPINNAYFKNDPIGNYNHSVKRPYFSYSFSAAISNYNSYGGGRRMYKTARRNTATIDSEVMITSSKEVSGAPLANSEEMMLDGVQMDKSMPQKDELDQHALQISDKKEEKDKPVLIRKNLKETVFFYPQLHTDEDGTVEIRFTMNEALTKWKFMTFAHTKDLQYVFDTKEIVTRKELMVFPLAPRFFREGDKIEFTSKVSNLSDKQLDIKVKLELFDALTNKLISILDGSQASQNITLAKDESGNISWKLKIPYGKYQAIGYRVIAKSGAYGDGEENTVPVVTNRMMVTETMPLPVKGNETKSFVFKSMKDKIHSPTLDNYSYTLEYTANPVWYAVQALPYIENSHHECSEFIFNKFFVNSLASHIANSSPKIQDIFEQWRNYDSDALLSNLSKNQELKSALLEETPWVLDAISEEQQKKNIALLFDLNKMSYEKTESIKKLREMQNHEGAFTWFPGGRSNRYMTQNIVEGIGHLINLGVIERNDGEIKDILDNAIPYLDRELTKQYKELKKWSKDLEKDHLGSMAIHYLYMRSFFQETKVANTDQTAYEYYSGQAVKYGLLKGVYLDGMVALVMERTGKHDRAVQITNSLAERAMYNDEMGMYWNETSGYNWYELPIERHSLLIESFTEVAKDQDKVDQLKTWLLKHKQTNNWKTTKATASAIYALLLANPGQAQNSVYKLSNKAIPKIKIANKNIDLSNVNKEAGTGYFKIKMDRATINENMAEVEVHNPNENIAWGSIYWQYFEDLDKIKTFKDTPLKMSKKLFKEVIGDSGEKLVAIDKSDKLIPGDKIIVRVIIEVDRAMEYVHLKDMRASGFEPINVLSRYKWQGGLGYYESTKDLATHFFMDYLPKGKYVFEYPLRVAHKGDFSNGITTIQCMYAPEFTSHSVGRRVLVE